jgi:hypothetical protein
MKIDRKKLYQFYMDEVNHIIDECDWKTHFTPEEIIGIVSSVIEKNPELIDKSDECPYCRRILQCYDLCGYEPCHCWRDE